MDLVVKGRGVQITDQFRQAAEHKIGKLTRLAPRAIRMELELAPDRNSMKHLEGTFAVPRHTFRAHAEGRDFLVALDLLVQRLERQVKDHRERRRKRLFGRGNSLESPRIGPAGTG